MTIKYATSSVRHLPLKPDDFIVFPTDYKIKTFPESLKVLIPHSFEVFKELSNFIKVNNSEIPKAFFFPVIDNLRIVTIVCINEDKLIDYKDLFHSLSYINEDNENCTIYICEEWFSKYLRNFEVFEYDLEKEFQDEDCIIKIINNIKDYKYDTLDESKEESAS